MDTWNTRILLFYFSVTGEWVVSIFRFLSHINKETSLLSTLTEEAKYLNHRTQFTESEKKLLCLLLLLCSLPLLEYIDYCSHLIKVIFFHLHVIIPTHQIRHCHTEWCCVNALPSVGLFVRKSFCVCVSASYVFITNFKWPPPDDLLSG